MKKAFVILSLCAAIAACGRGGSDNANTAGDVDSAMGSDVTAESRNPEVDTSVTNVGTDRTEGAGAGSTAGQMGPGRGEQLIAQSDCLSCHRADEKLVGPPYIDVANKYENTEKNLDYLAQKIIKGGSGVWGQVPMTPHPALSEDDAKDMARYILSLRK